MQVLLTEAQRAHVSGWGATMRADMSKVCAGFAAWLQSLTIPVWHDYAGGNAPGWAMKELCVGVIDVAMSEIAIGPRRFLHRNFNPRCFFTDVFARDPEDPEPRPSHRPGALYFKCRSSRCNSRG